MKYRLLLFKFEYIGNRFLFPIIISFDELHKAKFQNNIVKGIIIKLSEINGLINIVRIIDRVDIYENLQSELNSAIGEISLENIKTINIELRKSIKINPNEYTKGVFNNFVIGNIHLPIKKLDNFIDYNLNPFIIIDVSKIY